MRRRRAGRPWVLGAVTLFAAGVFFLGVASGLAGIIREPGGDTAISAVIGAALFGLFLVSIVRDLSTALGYLFVSADAGFLLAAPVPARALVLGRLLEAVVDAMPFVIVLVLPTLWGAGSASQAPLEFFPAAIAACVALVVISVGAGFTLAIGLAPLLPARRVRAWLRTIAAILYFGIWAAILWVTSGSEHGSGATIAGAGRTTVFATPGLPSTWASTALDVLRDGRWDPVSWGALFALVFAALSVTMALAPRYTLAWQSARPSAGRIRPRPQKSKREKRPPRAGITPAIGGSFGRLVSAFLRRDGRQLARDSAQISQLVTQAVFASALAFVFGARSPEGIRRAALAAALIFAIQLGFELGSRSLPRERGAIAFLLAAPLTALRHVAARACALAVPIVCAAGLVAATALTFAGAAGGIWGYTFALVAAAGLVAMAGGLAIGAWHGNPAWRSPAEMLDRTGQYLSVLVFALVVALAGMAGAFGPEPDGRLFAGGTAIASVTCALASLFLIDVSKRGIERLQLLNVREGLGEGS